MSLKLLERLEKAKLIQPPSWLPANTIYMTYMGSMVYGASNDMSDVDIYGAAIPPKEIVFPEQFAGEIFGFGRQIQRFEQWQQHHIKDPSKDSEYDFSIYNVVKYFQLLMDNNPNIIDSLFTHDRHVFHITPIGQHLRDNRDLFLHKGSMHKFRGYAHSQMSKIKNKTNSSNSKRAKGIEEFGYDVKFAYHVVRLCLEAEQIAREHTLDLERNGETLKSIRRGEWELERLENWLQEKLVSLETDYATSTLQNTPDEAKIKKVLLECLEMQYGDLNRVETQPQESQLVEELKQLVKKYSQG